MSTASVPKQVTYTVIVTESRTRVGHVVLDLPEGRDSLDHEFIREAQAQAEAQTDVEWNDPKTSSRFVCCTAARPGESNRIRDAFVDVALER